MKHNEHHPPCHATSIDAAIRKRSGRGAIVDLEMSSDQPSCTDTDTKKSTIHETPQRSAELPRTADLSGYEYLNHTADIQLHAWDKNLCGAMEKLAIAMFAYMTSLNTVEIDEELSSAVASNIVAEGHDLQSMIFNFLDEWLFVFHSTYFIAKDIKIANIDREKFKITSSAKGEKINISKHSQGTEIKAITYSNMQIEEDNSRCDIWVIVDI